MGELRHVEARFPEGFGVHRVALDPGHGAQGNTGNSSCFCIDEQDFTARLARDLATRLGATGHFEVRLTREADRKVEYKARVADAASWGAEVFVSLHSDVRGELARWEPEPGKSCPVSFAAPGFAVLYSDEGDSDRVARRRLLAQTITRRMSEVGFLPYGDGYDALYDEDAATRGMYVDRHAPEKRIFVLRRAEMPSVLIETHNATDPREALRWEDAATRVAFADAVGAALAEVLTETASARITP
jgi:N-acetylmuramoyl-L-alanine amidase